MTDAEVTIYNNINIFATEWRKYKPLGPQLSGADVKKTLYTKEYIVMPFMSTQSQKKISIIMFSIGSSFSTKSPQLRLLLNKFKDPTTIIMVSEQPGKSNIKKTLLMYPHLEIFNYLHQHFLIIIPNGPMCPKHRVLSSEEEKEVIASMHTHKLNLPKILMSDPQVIWCNGKPNDVIEITGVSDLVGEYISYRVVPGNGKIDTEDSDEEGRDEEVVVEENGANVVDELEIIEDVNEGDVDEE